jgi:hypothetical protein
LERLQTKTGKALAQNIMETSWDAWWLEHYTDK